MSYFRPAGQPFLIAGPCSAETKEQLQDAAASLREIPVHLFRAGVWKPRTRPGSFEGHGIEALSWLREIKRRYAMAVTIEIAEPAHIEMALRYDIDVFWIGARTTVNPFHVQQLADALRGTDMPVMVKNPVTPDVGLWEGAIERFERAGISNIAAVHRGFSVYDSPGPFRNPPNWIIPIELKRRRPDLSIFCDPSHIAGKRALIAELSQKALDMGFDGLMVETHPDPENAWTDAAQQITPGAFKEILKGLVKRKTFTADMEQAARLEYMRQLMDSVDAEIIDLLARRMELSRKMGNLKKDCNLTAYNPDRWREIVRTRSEHAQKQQLSEAYILSIYEKIHHESIRQQLDLFGKNGEEQIL